MIGIRDEHWVLLKGKRHPTWPGVLVALHENGVLGIEVTILQNPSTENGNTAICQAIVTMPGPDGRERIFSEIGDANPANVGSQIAPHITRMAACVPLGTEILTRAGWKTYDSLTVGEDVLAYDCGTDSCRWTPLEAISVFEDDHPTVRISSRSCSFVCTPNHSWAVSSPLCRTRLIETGRFGTGHSIVQAAVAEAGESSLSPREAAILGWLVTDGSVRECMVTGKWGTFGPYLRAPIDQSKEQYIPVLRDLLGTDAREFKFPPSRRDFGFMGGGVSDCKEAFRWYLKAPFLRQLYRNAEIEKIDELPSLVLRLSQPARAAMLEAMMQAEGHHKGGGRWEFYQRKPWVMEAFVLLATLEGRALGASSSKGVRWDKRALRSRRHLTTSYLLIEPEVAQPVWCPTTAFGTWVMRQDGMVSITGNTRAKGRAGRDAIACGETLREEIPDEEMVEERQPAHAAPCDGAAPAVVSSGVRAAEDSEASEARPAKHAQQCEWKSPTGEPCGKFLTGKQCAESQSEFQHSLCPAHAQQLRQVRAAKAAKTAEASPTTA